MIYLILICMIFMHVVDDYYLQGILASMKQKSWWEKNAPNPLYKHDYIVALAMHAFSWSFMIMLPAVLYMVFNGQLIIGWVLAFLFVNIALHALTDHEKANVKTINLIQDQMIHMVQILITWLSLVGLGGL